MVIIKRKWTIANKQLPQGKKIAGKKQPEESE
jgi:hypothetical protein